MTYARMRALEALKHLSAAEVSDVLASILSGDNRVSTRPWKQALHDSLKELLK